MQITQARLRDVAARRKVSQSQFVAKAIRRPTDDSWPAEALALAGSVPDFPDAKALRVGEVAKDAAPNGRNAQA